LWLRVGDEWRQDAGNGDRNDAMDGRTRMHGERNANVG
jgi:hypothetical protein